MESERLFCLDHISFQVTGKNILNDVSVNVNSGDFLAILGPSGSGKSTLLRLFNGLTTPTAGTIAYKNNPLATYSFTTLRKKVGMVFQTPVIVKGSVAENLLLIQKWEQPYPNINTDKLVELLRQTGLDDVRLSQDAKSLSGGEKQRLALARVLLNEPEVLLLDEPTANLDPQLARKIIQLVNDLYQSLGLTIIVVSHNHSLIQKYTSKVAFLINGQIVEQGPADIVYRPSTSLVKSFLTEETA